MNRSIIALQRFVLVGGLLVALCAGPLPARADEGGLSLLVLSLPKDSASQKAATTGAFVGRGVFARNPRYQILDLEAFLDQAQESPGRAAVTRALAAIEKGGHALDELELETAIASFNEAVVALEQGSAYVQDIRPYVDALLMLGSAYALNAEKNNARDAFRRALVIDRSATWDKMPEQAKKFFTEASDKVDAAPRGAVSVFTTPAAAEVYVDGNFQGPAPIVVERLTAGPHLLRLVLPGYRSFGRVIKVSGGSEETVQQSMKPTLKAAELEAITARLHGDVSAGQGPVLAELARFAKVDQAFVMSVVSSATDVRASAVLVDGTGQPLGSGQKAFTGERYRQELDEWIEGGFRSGQAGAKDAVQKDAPTKTSSNYTAPTGGGSSAGTGKIVGGALLIPPLPCAMLTSVCLVAGAGAAFFLALGFVVPRVLPVVGGYYISQPMNLERIVTYAVGFTLPAVALLITLVGGVCAAGGIGLIAWGSSERESMDAILAGGGGDAPRAQSDAPTLEPGEDL